MKNASLAPLIYPGGSGYEIAMSMFTGFLGGKVSGAFKPVPGINKDVGTLLSPSQTSRALKSQASQQELQKNVKAGAVSGAPFGPAACPN